MTKFFSMITLLLCLLTNSCKKDKSDLTYDCSIKTTSYSSSDSIRSWDMVYYKDNRLIKHVYLNGTVWEFKYDNRGNETAVALNGNWTKFEYNSANHIIRTEFFTNNKLDYFIISNYHDTLLTTSYSINNNNDTIGWSIYFYNTQNQIDSILSNEHNVYFYYSPEIDSVSIIGKDGKLQSVKYITFLNGKKVSEEVKLFDSTEKEYDHITRTWLNDNGFSIVKESVEYTTPTGELEWSGTKNFYDASNNLIKEETFDKLWILNGHTDYIYENTALIKTQSFNITNTMTGYSIIESDCKK